MANPLYQTLPLLTRAQAAELLATSERHLRRLSSRGDLPAVHIGGKVRYRLEDVQRLVEHQVLDNA